MMDKELKKLRDQIAKEQNRLVWQKVMKAKIKMIELQLKHDWRSDIYTEIKLDKYLHTLRPYSNRHKHKKNGGKGWKDDA